MRIAFLGSRHPGSNYSGIERVLSAMLPLLKARGHEITVFSAPLPGEAPGRSTWNGIEVVGMTSLNGKHSESLSRTALSMIHAVSGRFDVLHFTHLGPGVFAPLARLLRIPSVVSVAGLDWQRAKWGRAASFAIRGAERLAARHASAIIVLSTSIQSYLREAYGRESIYIPNGLERKAAPHSTGELSRIGVRPDNYILFAGRLVPEKAIHELISAWNGVDTDIKLVVAGGARYDDAYVKSLYAMSTDGKVIFTGHVEGATIAELFGHCHLFVLPSHVEGQSVALLEALGYGRATLVSSIPENTDVVGGNGFVFPVGDVAALRTSLQELVDSPSLVQALRAKLQETECGGHASWEDVARMHENVYMSVAHRSRHRAEPAHPVAPLEATLKTSSD